MQLWIKTQQDQVHNANSAFILIKLLIRRGFQSGLIGPGGPGGQGGPGGSGGKPTGSQGVKIHIFML